MFSRSSKKTRATTSTNVERDGGRSLFGGIDPEVLADVIGGGFATWVDTDEADEHVVDTQGVMVAHAPIETAFETVTDFRNIHRFMGVSRKSRIHHLGRGGGTVKLRQGIGLGPFSVGLTETFRFTFERPESVRCGEYLEGPFSHASLGWELYELPEQRTLIRMTFICDLTELGGLIRRFFDAQPEIAFAAGANTVVVPLIAYVDEAEKRAGRSGTPRPPARPLYEHMAEGRLSAPLAHGYLTVGRLDKNGGLIDVAAATRLGAPPEEVWPAVEDPAVLTRTISFLEEGKLTRVDDERSQQDLTYTVRFGPLKKRYRYHRMARCEPPRVATTLSANLDGLPVEQSEHLIEEDGETLLCHIGAMDLKKDWFANLFLRHHPEFECLIGTYSPAVFVRGVRLCTCPPR